MIAPIHIGVGDFERAFSFYSPLMDQLGLRLKFSDADKPWAAWMPAAAPRPLLLIGAAFDGQPAIPGNGQMVTLLAPSRVAVDRAYATALDNGSTCEGPPGLRPHYHPDYYGAYLRDPGGNKLCICCHEPETT